MSRDPIDEKGGWNLYGMVNNNPVDAWDLLGLKDSIFQRFINFCTGKDTDNTDNIDDDLGSINYYTDNDSDNDSGNDSDNDSDNEKRKNWLRKLMKRAENGEEGARLEIEMIKAQGLNHILNGLGLETKWKQFEIHEKVLEISLSKNSTQTMLGITNLLTLGLYGDTFNPSRLMLKIILPKLGGCKSNFR